MNKLHFNKIVLIGVGLIGSSLSYQILKNGLVEEVIGYDQDKKNLDYAIRHKLISKRSRNLKKELQEADLVIFAVPVLVILKLMKEWADDIPKSTIVMDVGSTKKSIIKLAEKVFPKGNFIGAHPMAGKEKTGAKAVIKGLFVDKTAILVKTKHTKKDVYKRAYRFWRAIGSWPVEMNPEKHDEYLAYISHLPHAVSFGFALTVAHNMSAKEADRYSGGGFRDTSRIAASDYKMWHDIFFDNKKYLLKSLKEMKDYLKHFEDAIKRNDEDKLKDLMVNAAEFRRKIR